MNFRKTLTAALAAAALAVGTGSAWAENTVELGGEYTGYDSETVDVYDNDLGDYALDTYYIVASFELAEFDSDGGFAFKMVVNDDGSANDFYFLTLTTNSWATVDSGYGVVENPIVPTETGIYNVKFDVSSLGELTNIKFNLWQGTVKLYGVAFLDSDGNALYVDGEIKTSTAGCYTPEDGQVDEFVIGNAETTTEESTETTTEAAEVVTIETATDTESSESIMSSKMPWLFNLLSSSVFGIRVVWLLVGLFFVIGVVLIVIAIALIKKKKRDAKKAAKNKSFKKYEE